ncbi:dienelactone hydrolase family protein [Cryptosporangium sp. NPDC048952]|uniref:dienelactone hydrolase family protein n=1 Tax=Cryptosporangium sp. NPDC048952 TaxID=3363961 RepID=UPI00370F8587
MRVLVMLVVVALGLGVWVSASGGGARHVVVDGVPLDEVHPAGEGKRPGVVVAHGFAGSALLMRQFGDTLAARGYVVVLLDFSGHGANTQVRDLQSDLDVAMAHLRGLRDVDASRVAVVGHSMGAGAAVRYGATHPDVTATVAISLPSAADVRAGAPRRLLSLVGSAEFAGFRDAAERAAVVSGGEVVRVPWVEHVSILWAPRTHREVVDWLDAAFGVQSGAGDPPSPFRRLVGAGLLLVAFALGFVPLTRLALGGGAARGALGGAAGTAPAGGAPRGGALGGVARWRLRVRGGWLPTGLGRAVVVAGVASVVAAVIAAVLPTGMVPLAIAGFLIAFTTLIGLALIGFAAWRARRTADATAGKRDAAEPARGDARAAHGDVGPVRGLGAAAGGAGPVRRPEAVVRGGVGGTARRVSVTIVLVAYAGAAIAVPLQVGVTHAVPVGARWWVLALIWAGFTVLAYGAGRLTDGSGLGLLAVSAVTALVLTVAAVTGLTSGFVLLVVPLLAALMVWQSAWTEVLRRHAAPLWLAAPVGAILVAWPVAVTLPLT